MSSKLHVTTRNYDIVTLVAAPGAIATPDRKSPLYEMLVKKRWGSTRIQL